MENFYLWDAGYAAHPGELTFFATRVQVQRIHRGTRAMVDRMLADLGVARPDVEDWSLDHVASSYLSDNLDSADWREVWLDTWRVRVRTPKPAEHGGRGTDLVSTYAFDETWDGDEGAAASICLVVADFYDPSTIARGKVALNWIGMPGRAEAIVSDIVEQAPALKRQPLMDVRHELERRVGGHVDAMQPLRVRQQPGFARQLLVEVPSDLQFFEEGARAAVLLERLCRHIGGTTSWRARMSRDR